MSIQRNSHANNIGIVNMDYSVIRPVESPEAAERTFSFTDFTGEKTLMFTRSIVTLYSIRSVCIGTGSPTANLSLHFHADRSNTGNEIISIDCSNTTTGLVSTDFSISVIPKDSWVWLTFDDTDADLDQFDLVINY